MITDEERETLRGMTETEIRRAQNIINAQIPLAYAQGNNAALAQLREWEQSYIDEMASRLYR